MQSKRNSLLLWMEKKGRFKEKEAKEPRFQFPVVIVVCGKRQRLRFQRGEGWLAMGFREGEVYSETDLIEEAFKAEDFLQERQIKIEEKQT